VKAFNGQDIEYTLGISPHLSIVHESLPPNGSSKHRRSLPQYHLVVWCPLL